MPMPPGSPVGHLLLALADVGEKAIQIGDPPLVGQRLGKNAGRRVAVGVVQVQDHEVLGNQ